MRVECLVLVSELLAEGVALVLHRGEVLHADLVPGVPANICSILDDVRQVSAVYYWKMNNLGKKMHNLFLTPAC